MLIPDHHPSRDPRDGGSLRELSRLRARIRQLEEALSSASASAERQARAARAVVSRYIRGQRIARLGSWEWDRRTGVVTCSAELYRIVGMAAHQPTCSAHDVLRPLHEEDRRRFRQWIVDLARGKPREPVDVRAQLASEVRHVHVLGEPLRTPDGRIIGVTGTLQEATERTRAIQQIHRLAYYDVLTDLPNRSRFNEALVETLALAERESGQFAIMFLDLDHFKRVNDSFGHAMGDELLRLVAHRLKSVLRLDDVSASVQHRRPEGDVCRQGGDEFVVLLKGIATEADAERAVRRLLDALAQPITLGSHEIFISASIGVALYPRDGGDLDALIKNADVAMYRAKAEGRNRHVFYHDGLRAATARKLSLDHDLRKAVEGEQFVLHYQPQIDVRSGAIVGLEALIRWNHPTLGLLPPASFIEVAEENGLIMAIWEWVLVSTLIQHNTWLQEGLPCVTIGVNLSSVQFSDKGLARRVEEISSVVGVSPTHIELEVTESMLMNDFEGTLATLNALRAMGVQIAIDDFGTGYSSLSYLRRLPIDKLKLDQSFTRDAAESGKGAAITKAIIAMAHSLDLKVVAEGVETQAQLELLCGLGCTTMQGYLLSRPMPAGAIGELLRRNVPAGIAQAR